MATFTANINLGKFMQSKWSQDAPTIEAAQRLVFAHLERILSVEPTDQRGEEAHFCIRQYMQLLALPETEPDEPEDYDTPSPAMLSDHEQRTLVAIARGGGDIPEHVEGGVIDELFAKDFIFRSAFQSRWMPTKDGNTLVAMIVYNAARRARLDEQERAAMQKARIRTMPMSERASDEFANIPLAQDEGVSNE